MTPREARRLILVSGATGKQGGAVARQLLEKGFTVRALTRYPDSEAAKELGRLGAEIVEGNLDDAASLERALRDAWGVFSVQNFNEVGVRREEEQGRRFAELARKCGVQHFVYSSAAAADRKTGIPHFESKARIEEVVRKLNFLSYTILRPVFFMENFLNPMVWPGLEQGKLMLPLRPETRLHMIAVEDIGRFGSLAFEKPGFMDLAEIEIAGDVKTMAETASILGRVLGRPIRFEPLSLEQVRRVNEDLATMFEWLNRVGFKTDIASLSARYDIRPLTLKQWATTKARWPSPVNV